MFAQCAPRRRGRGSKKRPRYNLVEVESRIRSDATVTWRFCKEMHSERRSLGPNWVRVLGGTRSGAGYSSIGTTYTLWLTQVSIRCESLSNQLGISLAEMQKDEIV